MDSILKQFASAEPASGGVLGALGIDWKTLIIQIIAFLLLLALLKKSVFPWLMKSVDERQSNIEIAAKAASQAQAMASDAQAKVTKMLDTAKLEAADIVAKTKLESEAASVASEKKAKERSEQIISEAQAEINKEVIAAKKTLHNETLELVAMATEKIVRKVVTSDIDTKLIEDSIKAVK